MKMKKLVVTLSALAAFTGSALAADMAPRTYSKAPPPPPAPVASWTGCYIGGGGGYGMYNQESTEYDATVTPRRQVADTFTNGGRGYFGTVQGGCDYQFDQFVVGAFGDYDFSSIKGRFGMTAGGRTGDEKLSGSWAVGGRAGWIVFPGLLTYFSAGYTEATFDQFNIAQFLTPPSAFFPKATYKGYFIGAGDEYALKFLPGLFWKTEYRVSAFDTRSNEPLAIPTGTRTFSIYDQKKWEQSIRSELVYRFNWGGPVVAKY
jgi:outer membrane immunogenic protein